MNLKVKMHNAYEGQRAIPRLFNQEAKRYARGAGVASVAAVLIFLYLILSSCTPGDSQPTSGQEYRRISPAELDSLWRKEVARWPGYRQKEA